MKNLFLPGDFPDLLAGLSEPDDAAVWRIDHQRALVITTDFFTPVVDEPYLYGAIAATNSLSDIYAMGGKPFFALNIAALPPNLPPDICGEILRGGAEKVKEAGAVIVGGHTIQDKEPKYGLVAVGMVNPDRLLTKSGAQPGDVLLISKPLGVGVTTTLIKAEKASADMAAEAIQWMMRLNETAGELAVEFNARATTDVTGFSLLGHAWEMASASKVGFQFSLSKIPFLSDVHQFAAQWAFPGGAFDNMEFFQPFIEFSDDIPLETQLLLFDPQTSGGILMAVPKDQLEPLLARAEKLGQPLWRIGEVIEKQIIMVTQ